MRDLYSQIDNTDDSFPETSMARLSTKQVFAIQSVLNCKVRTESRKGIVEGYECAGPNAPIYFRLNLGEICWAEAQHISFREDENGDYLFIHERALM